MIHRPRSWVTGVVLALGGLVLAASAVGVEGPLDQMVRAAIDEALQDEYQGEAIYARVLKDHGELRPFSRVVHAEQRHAAFLEELLTGRGLAVPENRWAGADVPSYASVTDACLAAVEFEVRNVALYDRLLAAGSLPDDVRRAFEHNRRASLEHHKPAFERCAGWAGAPARGATASGRGGGGCGHARLRSIDRGGRHGCGSCGGDGCPGGCGRGGGR